VQVLDDARRLEHRAALVDQHRESLHRPQHRQFGHVLAFVELAVLKRRAVLVQRDQRLLAVGREWVGVEDRGHGVGLEGLVEAAGRSDRPGHRSDFRQRRTAAAGIDIADGP